MGAGWERSALVPTALRFEQCALALPSWSMRIPDARLCLLFSLLAARGSPRAIRTYSRLRNCYSCCPCLCIFPALCGSPSPWASCCPSPAPLASLATYPCVLLPRMSSFFLSPLCGSLRSPGSVLRFSAHVRPCLPLSEQSSLPSPRKVTSWQLQPRLRQATSTEWR